MPLPLVGSFEAGQGLGKERLTSVTIGVTYLITNANQLPFCHGGACAGGPRLQGGRPCHFYFAGVERQYEPGDYPAFVADLAKGQAHRDPKGHRGWLPAEPVSGTHHAGGSLSGRRGRRAVCNAAKKAQSGLSDRQQYPNCHWQRLYLGAASPGAGSGKNERGGHPGPGECLQRGRPKKLKDFEQNVTLGVTSIAIGLI